MTLFINCENSILDSWKESIIAECQDYNSSVQRFLAEGGDVNNGQDG